MILTKTISVSIKHENVFKDVTDVPVEQIEKLDESQIKKEDEDASRTIQAVMESVDNLMKGVNLDE